MQDSYEKEETQYRNMYQRYKIRFQRNGKLLKYSMVTYIKRGKDLERKSQNYKNSNEKYLEFKPRLCTSE